MKTKNILILLTAVFGSYLANAQCKAKFSYYVDQSTMTVYFYDSSTSSGGVTDWVWTFGDGTADYAQKTNHQYRNNGTFTVCLSIYDSATKCGDKVCASVTIASKSCKADFWASPDTNYLDYNFYSYTNTTGVIHEWTIDGKKQSSTAGTIKYTFSSKGTYTACLKITDTSTKCTDSICHTIVVALPCYSSFKYYVYGDTMDFVSSYNPLKVKWDFGDGKGSTADYGTHVYAKQGAYNVCLTVYCSSTDSSQTCMLVYVGANYNCKADFAVVLDTTQKFKLLLINKSTKSTTATYYWDFGDGNSSTKRNPTHKYKSFGRYLVCLTITDYTGGRMCTDTYCDSLGLDSSGKLLKADGFDIEVRDEEGAGIKNLNMTSVNLYPNPVSDKLHVHIENAFSQYQRLEILNAQGQIVIGASLAESDQSSPVVIETQNLSSGIYFLRMIGVERTESLKFIRE